MEIKCPHCDQWVSSGGKSCSKCGALLYDSKQGANPLISSLKDNWKLATGLAGAVLILSVLFLRPNPTPPPKNQGMRGPESRFITNQRDAFRKRMSERKTPDLSGQLGFYGQWDEDKDGYLNGTEIVAAMTELNKVEVNTRDINGESHLIKFRWEPPRDIDLDQRLSREEFTQAARRYYPLFEEYDLNKDDLLSRVEIEKEPVLDKAGFRRKQLHFEPLKKFDLNQDGKLALLEIPPYHLYSSPFGMNSLGGGSRRGSRGSGRGSASRGSGSGGRASADEVINRALTDYKTNLGAQAAQLQDLVNEGYLNSIPDPPAGTKWVLNPDGTLTTQRK